MEEAGGSAAESIVGVVSVLGAEPEAVGVSEGVGSAMLSTSGQWSLP